MNLDDAIGIVAREALALRRYAKKYRNQGTYRIARALSLVMWAAKEHQDLDRKVYRAQRGEYLKNRYSPENREREFELPGDRPLSYTKPHPDAKPRQVAPFMFECPGCLQHFGRGKGPYGLARHCCHESHPRLRRAR